MHPSKSCEMLKMAQAEAACPLEAAPRGSRRRSSTCNGASRAFRKPRWRLTQPGRGGKRTLPGALGPWRKDKSIAESQRLRGEIRRKRNKFVMPHQRPGHSLRGPHPVCSTP
uniref:Uncharacterized protein n=1 Tax=Canis lupus dingo TaxID=286419 RepID=A0A8C0L182_CANLU